MASVRLFVLVFPKTMSRPGVPGGVRHLAAPAAPIAPALTLRHCGLGPSRKEGRQPDRRRICHLGDDLANGRKAQRIVVACPNNVQKNGFVARLSNAATDGV